MVWAGRERLNQGNDMSVAEARIDSVIERLRALLAAFEGAAP